MITKQRSPKATPREVHRLHKQPSRDSAEWAKAESVKFVADMNQHVVEMDISPGEFQKLKPEVQALIDIRSATSYAHGMFQSGYEAVTTSFFWLPKEQHDHYNEAHKSFVRELIATDAIFHVAMEGRIHHIEQQLSFEDAFLNAFIDVIEMWSVWQCSPQWGSFFELAEQSKKLARLTSEIEEHWMQTDDPDLWTAYSKVHEDLVSKWDFPFTLSPELIGVKGGAATDAAGAMRGWFVRALDQDMPIFTRARSAAIADLLAVAQVDDVDATKVRTLLSRKTGQQSKT